MTNNHRICKCQPVGLADIADELGLKRQTLHLYSSQGIMPEPRWMVSGKPVWCWEQDIIPWLATRRQYIKKATA